MANRKRTKKRRRSRISRENRVAMIAILIVVCLLFAVLTAEGFRLNRKIDDNEARRIELQQQIDEEEARTSEIESLKEYMETDEYIRQAAKEKLGLVESDEIIFKSADR